MLENWNFINHTMVSLDGRNSGNVFWWYIIVFSMSSYAIGKIVNYTAQVAPSFQDFENISITGFSSTPRSDDKDRDIVAEFLDQVEKHEQSKENCTPGTKFNLGEGVIQQYGINKFKRQALVAVNRANLLTRLWKEAPQEVLDSEYLLYAQVRNFVEGDPEIFAAGNCYDHLEYKNYYLFCPYAHRTEDGMINVKDLSIEYDYLGNDSEWFYTARMKASKLENFNYTIGK